MSFRQVVAPDPSQLLRTFISAAPWVVGATILTVILEIFGWLSPFANLTEDAFGLLESKQNPQNVAIIDIDRASFTDPNIFGARRPLSVSAISALIDDVASAGPTVIGIDLLTSDPSFRALHFKPTWPPIVWAQDIVPADRSCINITCEYQAIPVLGGGASFSDGTGACRGGHSCAAIPVRETENRVGRQYQRIITIPGLQGRPTFAWAIIQVCAAATMPAPGCVRSTKRAGTADGQPSTLRFRYDDSWPGMVYTAQTVLAEARANPRAWARDEKLKGHVALIGGTYDAGDVHLTSGSSRPRPGLIINAQIIEGELADVPVRVVPLAILAALDLLIAFALIYFAYRFPPLMAFGAGVGLLFVIVALSYAFFHTINIWLNFVPVMTSVVLHELNDHLREYLRLRAKEHAVGGDGADAGAS